jgi:hypothetical protein
MRQIMQLFDPHGFVPRRMCGDWSPGLLALHQVSDAVVWVSYMLIAIMLWKFYRSWRQGRLDPVAIERNTKLLMIEFTGFTCFCGISHLHQVIVFWYPAYRWFGIWSALTAFISAMTVGTLSIVLGMALRPKAVR